MATGMLWQQQETWELIDVCTQPKSWIVLRFAVVCDFMLKIGEMHAESHVIQCWGTEELRH